MSTLNLQVGSSADDGRYSSDSGTGSVYSAFFPLIGHVLGSTDVLNAWFRLTGVSGLSGATIDAATFSLRGFASDLGTPLTNVYAEDATAPAAVTSHANGNAKTRTTAFVAWDNLDLVTTGFKPAPDCKTVIQELADSYDPSTIQILLDDDGSDTGGDNIAQPSDYGDGSAKAAKLDITFTAVTAPAITDLDPNSGLAAGGTAVTITGTAFGGTTGVTFDGTPATSVVVVSSTEVTCVSPAHAAGTVRVILTTSIGSSSDVSADDYTYFDPTLSVEDDIRTHLITQLTGEPAIFVQGLPAAPDDAIGIVMNGGPPPALAMGPAVVERMFFFSVYVRSGLGRGEATETLMQQVHAVLRAAKDVTINATTYDQIVSSSIPRREDDDLNGRPVQSATYTIWRAGS